MVYKAERIENLDELEAIHRNLFTDASNLRAELEKENPNMDYIYALAKAMHMESHKAVNFEFFITQRTIKEESEPISKCSCKYAVRSNDKSVPRPN